MSVVFGVARWVTYLEKEKGAPAGGGAGAKTEDDEEGATPAQNEPRGRTASHADGAAVTALWTTRRLRCRDGTGSSGTYVRLTASAFAGLQCECAAAARPAAAGRLSGMKIEPQKCVIFYA